MNIGDKYNSLVVVKFSHRVHSKSYWIFKCDCGVEKCIRGDCVKSGRTKTCSGHKTQEFMDAVTKHGSSKSRTYNSWHQMKQRCNNPNEKKWKFYGGRGIKHDEKWNDFTGFLEDMGERPEGTSLGRIDNDGDYCKENCRWEDDFQQNNNTSFNHIISYKGEEKTVAQWVRELNLCDGTVRSRIKKRYSVDIVFSSEKFQGKKIYEPSI